MKQSVQHHHADNLFDQANTEPSVFPFDKFDGKRALEEDNFPFEELSNIAELESWRKEINRPVYHIHKWWAQRLGTVFRAIVLGALSPAGTDLLDAFYKPTRLNNSVVYDPFMGSGTTLGEAAKLGARVIGRDINPVAHFLVRNALSIHDRQKIESEFQSIAQDVSNKILRFYKTELADGSVADVLYFFWVKIVACPSCQNKVDLFSSRIFTRHAYPKRHPESRATCPDCGEVNIVRYDAKNAKCGSCNAGFDPQKGPAKGQNATCPDCGHTFPIRATIQKGTTPPNHRMYAKLVLLPDGTKEYFRATEADNSLYDSAQKELAGYSDAYPTVAIESGYNTNQAIGYNYNYWHQMFNSRQLLCLSILAKRIKSSGDPLIRDLFACLFSGVCRSAADL